VRLGNIINVNRSFAMLKKTNGGLLITVLTVGMCGQAFSMKRDLEYNNKKLPVLKKFKVEKLPGDFDGGIVYFNLKGVGRSVVWIQNTKKIVLVCGSGNGTNDGTIQILNFCNGISEFITLSKKENPITEIAVSPNGRYVISGHKDGTVKYYDIKTKKIKNFSPDKDRDRVRSLFVAHDNTFVSVAYLDGSLLNYPLSNSKNEQKIIFDSVEDEEIDILSMSISRNGEKSVLGLGDGRVVVFYDDVVLEKEHSENDAVSSIAITSDDNFVVSSSWDGTIKVWLLNNGAEQFISSSLEKHSSPIYAMGVTVDDGYIVSGDEKGVIKIHDFNTGTMCNELMLDERITSLVLPFNGTYMASIIEEKSSGKLIVYFFPKRSFALKAQRALLSKVKNKQLTDLELKFNNLNLN